MVVCGNVSCFPMDERVVTRDMGLLLTAITLKIQDAPKRRRMVASPKKEESGEQTSDQDWQR